MDRGAFVRLVLVISLSIWIAQFYGDIYGIIVTIMWFVIAALAPIKKPTDNKDIVHTSHDTYYRKTDDTPLMPKTGNRPRFKSDEPKTRDKRRF